MEQKNYKILVVDDHSLIRQMVTITLKRSGFTQIDAADDGVTALAHINAALEQGTPFDVVFLDWSMPNHNGYEMLQICRKDSRLNKMAIIMLTSESEDGNITMALDAGANAYITKPFRPEHITQKLDEVEAWRKTLASQKRPQ